MTTRRNIGLAIAIAGILAVLAYAPWVNETIDFGHPMVIGRAPVWSHQFPRPAHVEWGEEGILIVIVLALAGVVFFRKR
jgi:hypothetical protein